MQGGKGNERGEIMARNHDFYEEVAKSVRSSAKKMRDLTERMDKLREQKDSGDYSKDYIAKNINPELFSEKRVLDELKVAGMKEIQALCDSYTSELQDEDTLKGSELTDDARLLSSGIKLNKNDLDAMLRRNEGNRTMTQLILRHAEANKIDLGRIYMGNNPTIATIKSVPYISGIALKWYNNPDMVERFVGEGSDLEGALSD